MAHYFITFIKRIVTACVVAMLFVSGSGFGYAAIATPSSDTLSRLQIGVAADHELVITTPTGIDAATDTITIGLSAFTFGAIAATDVSVSWGPTGFEHASTVAALPGVGTWGAVFGGGSLTLTAPTDAVGPSAISAGQKIGIRIGLNAGGANQLTNPAVATIALIAIGGTFGDSNTIAIPIVSSDAVTVSATVPAATTSSTSTPPCTGCGGGGGGGGGSVLAPVISNVQATMITTSTALITWTTDQNTNSTVNFGQDVTYASGTVVDGGQVMAHALQITGLIPNQLYHFQVSSLNGTTLLGATSGDFTFTTLAENIPLIISNVQVLTITDTTALVTWNTNKPASSLVNFGLTAGYGLTASSPGLVTTHAVSLSGMTPATLYHFDVVSVDASNASATSPDGTFTTLSDITPPANVINLSVTPGDTVNVLNWTLPPDPDFAGTKILRKLGSHPTNPFDGVVVYDGSAVTTIDTGLTNGTMYFYTAYAYDTTGNFASGALGQGMPNGPIVVPPTSTPPVIPPTSTPPVLPPAATTTPPVVVTTSTPPLPTTADIQVRYYGANGSILLSEDANGRIGVLAGSPVRVVLPLAGMSSIPTTVTVTVGGNAYVMTYVPTESVFAATIVLPNPGEVNSRVSAVFSDGSQRQVTNILLVQSGGLVTESSLVGATTKAIPGAEVVLFREIGGNWVRYGAAETSAAGAFAFVVPNGRYYVEVGAAGFEKRVSNPLFVDHNVYNESQSLIQRPLEIPKIDIERPIVPQAVEIGRAITQNASTAVQRVVQNPRVQETAAASAPIVTALALVNTASALSLFNFLAYLQYLFTQPLLLLFPNRRKKWGVVYNSLSKKPIDLAIVRLLQFETRLVVQTKVTDKQGRYSFDVKKGNYLIEVVKPGYVFPSDYLKDKKEDVDYVDLYFGTKIEVLEASAVVALNVPLDPIVNEETPQRVLWRKALRSLRHALAFSGVILGMVIVFVQPTFVHGLLLLGQIGVYLLFRRIATPSHAGKWGSVVDAKTKKPMQNVVVRIFDKKFNKLLETQVTDRNGTYGFFVGRNVYYVTAQKAGYVRYVSPDLDLSKKDSAVVDQNIRLVPEEKK